MCHGAASAWFPTPDPRENFSTAMEGLAFGEPDAVRRIVLIPDIYGPNAFYQGLATHLSGRGARVYLVNPFAGLGELPEASREAAFARRHKVRDRQCVDSLERFCAEQDITGVVGFCLGGSYVFELARRGASQDLVGFYGFPQGMENADPLQRPFDYLPATTTPQLCLMPGQDQSVGVDNVARLAKIAATNPTIDLSVYAESGHGFLADLDSDDATLRGNAEQALARCEQALGLI